MSRFIQLSLLAALLASSACAPAGLGISKNATSDQFFSNAASSQGNVFSENSLEAF